MVYLKWSLGMLPKNVNIADISWQKFFTQLEQMAVRAGGPLTVGKGIAGGEIVIGIHL